MTNPFAKIIDLIKKTGDKSIVLDEYGNPQFVIMGFREYERLVEAKPNIAALTEEELLDRINQDIGAWKEAQADPDDMDWQDLGSLLEEARSRIQEPEYHKNSLNEDKNKGIDDQYYFEPIE